METAENIAAEIRNIIEAHRVTTATTSEALATRADALADLALGDAIALDVAMQATALTYLYSEMQKKIEAVMNNPEQIEAILDKLENMDDNFNGHAGGPPRS